MYTYPITAPIANHAQICHFYGWPESSISLLHSHYFTINPYSNPIFDGQIQWNIHVAYCIMIHDVILSVKPWVKTIPVQVMKSTQITIESQWNPHIYCSAQPPSGPGICGWDPPCRPAKAPQKNVPSNKETSETMEISIRKKKHEDGWICPGIFY